MSDFGETACALAMRPLSVSVMLMFCGSLVSLWFSLFASPYFNLIPVLLSLGHGCLSTLQTAFSFLGVA